MLNAFSVGVTTIGSAKGVLTGTPGIAVPCAVVTIGSAKGVLT